MTKLVQALILAKAGTAVWTCVGLEAGLKPTKALYTLRAASWRKKTLPLSDFFDQMLTRKASEAGE